MAAESENLAELGSQRLARGEYDQAYSAFLQALQGSVSKWYLYEGLAKVSTLLGNAEQAEHWWLRAVQELPNNSIFLAGLGTSQFRQGKYNKAILSFERALAIEPGNLNTRISLSLAHLNSGENSEALLQSRKGLFIDESSIDLRLVRARSLILLGRHEEAVIDLAWLYHKNAKLWEVALLECQVNRARGDFETALFLAAEVCEKYPLKVAPLNCFREIFFNFIGLASTKRVDDFLQGIGLPLRARPQPKSKSKLNKSRQIDHTIDIIIPVYNSIDHLKNCLESIEEARTSLLGKIILVDDCSSPEVSLWMYDLANENSDFLLLRTPLQSGFSKALSLGISNSFSDRFVALNSDCVVGKGWLEKLNDAMGLESLVAMVGPLSNNAAWQSIREIFDVEGNFAVHYMPSDQEMLEIESRLNEINVFDAPQTSLVHGFCVLVDRSIYDNLGGLNVELFPQGYGEFQDLSLRAIDEGFELKIADNCFVAHARGASITDPKRESLSRDGRNTLYSQHTALRYLSAECYACASTQVDFAREVRGATSSNSLVRERRRFDSIWAHQKYQINDIEWNSLLTAISTLDCSYDDVVLKPITFPRRERPKVSVIIPAHNKVEMTYFALCAILLAYNSAMFEVILVDDGSTDATRELEKIVTGIRVVRNLKPQYFVRACNAGVEIARGEYVILLNNDTEPTAGWIDTLLDAFDRFENVGLTGSKLLYMDGSLQDAGGIVWDNGEPSNYGNRLNPWEPQFSYARQVDYLSGASLMTTKAIWDQVGGFSKCFEPMYFEDTDFSFKVRELGFKTWFVPSSIVYHYEGATSGTDIGQGLKRYQEINQPKFQKKWEIEFKDFGKYGHLPDIEKDRGNIGRILFIDSLTPVKSRDAGSYASLSEIELVQSLGYKVTFMPANLAHFGRHTDYLEQSGVEVIVSPFFLTMEKFLEERAAEFDAVYITRYTNAQKTIHLIRKFAPKAKILLNIADLHFLRELRAAINVGDASLMNIVKRIREDELEAMVQADLVLSYNEVEHALITSHTDGKARVMTCPWVIDAPKSVPQRKTRSGMSFLGGFGHLPNAEGIKWFCKEVMPHLNDAKTDLTIYGSRMGRDIHALAGNQINTVGFIEEVAKAYDQHLIFIAPLLSGTGIKGKVLGALAHGIPCVLSPIAAEGIGLRHGHDCLIAKSPQEWTNAIDLLTKDASLWKKISQAGRTYVTNTFSFYAGRQKIKAAFEVVFDN